MSNTCLTSAGKTYLLLVLTGILLVATGIFVVLNRTTTSFTYYAPVDVRSVVITGYSSEVSQTDDTPFLTASQKHVQKGFIACPRNIPFGSMVEIEGKQYVCEDRMAKKYNNRFDVWFSSKAEALNWGKQIKTVIIR